MSINIKVLNREKMRILINCAVIEKNTAIISINDANQEIIPNNLPSGQFLSLHFDDVDKEGDQGEPMEFIDAFMISVFVQDAIKRGVTNFVINCKAGICRSAGVAAALSLVFNGNDEEFFKRPFCPNMLCYRLVLRAFGIELEPWFIANMENQINKNIREELELEGMEMTYELEKITPEERYYEVVITADSNDGDYVTSKRQYNQEEFNVTAPLLRNLLINHKGSGDLGRYLDTLYDGENDVEDIVLSYIDFPNGEYDMNCHTLKSIDVKMVNIDGSIYKVNFKEKYAEIPNVTEEDIKWGKENNLTPACRKEFEEWRRQFPNADRYDFERGC